MSNFIDYSQRGRGRRGLPSTTSEDESGTEQRGYGGASSNNPFSDTTIEEGTTTEPEATDSEVPAANPYASPFSNNNNASAAAGAGAGAAGAGAAAAGLSSRGHDETDDDMVTYGNAAPSRYAQGGYQAADGSDNRLRQEQSSHGERQYVDGQQQSHRAGMFGDTMPRDPHEQHEFFDPTFDDFNDEQPLEMVFFDHVVQNYGEMGIIGKTQLFVRQTSSFFITLGALGIVLVASFASYLNPLRKSPPKARPDREYERRMTGERFSGKPQYYSNFWGYRCDEHDIITEGGWILKAHRVSDPRRGHAPGYPVILQHGILCNSSHFFVCEERSMAFWMVDQGYDVWVTNIRANFKAGHTQFTRNDPRYWAFGMKELSYDLRDVVEFITGATGRPRVAYVGHSQGAGTMYIALSPGICPELGRKISSFTAIGPAVYSGPVLRTFPFSLMRQFRSRKWWTLIFGIKEFIPAIGLFQELLPGFIFGHLGFVIFSYLFGFHDHNWVNRQKPKIFRTLPVPTSSELLYYYMSGFSHRGCVFDPRVQEPWFPRTFPRHSVYYGDLDQLVLGKPLAERLERHERNVDVVHCVELKSYEHLDFIMGVDAFRTVYPGIKDTIESSITDDERAPEMAEIEQEREYQL